MYGICGPEGLVSLNVTDLMRALIIDGPRSARVTEVEIPVPAVGQLVVDVHRVGICGTDFELFGGDLAYFEQGEVAFPAPSRPRVVRCRFSGWRWGG